MTLTADQLRELCRRRDVGILAQAAAADPDAARLTVAATPAELHALHADGHAARREMIEQHLGLVGFAIARLIPTAGLERDDYFQQGVIGLATAVDRYDNDRSQHFSGFALAHIRGAVNELVRTRGGDLRPSQSKAALLVQREITRRQANGLPITTSAIAASLGIGERQVAAGMSYGQPVSLDTAIRSRDLPEPEVSAADAVGDAAPSAARMLFMLPPLERRTLEAVHGEAGVGRTMSQIADELGLSTRQLRGTLDSGYQHLRALLGSRDADLGDRRQQRRGRAEERSEPPHNRAVASTQRR